VVNDHDIGRKPEVRGTEIQEKTCIIEVAARKPRDSREGVYDPEVTRRMSKKIF
jgi:hypothetical protein